MKYLASFILILPSLAAALDVGCVSCPAEDGIFSHPTRYDSLIKCRDGVAYFETCPQGTIYLKEEQRCGPQKTKNILRPSRLAGIKLSSCPKSSSGVDPHLSSSTSTSGACAQGCSAYSGFTTGTEVHSVCNAENGPTTCTNAVLARGLTADYGTQIVAAHNVRRDELAGGAWTSTSIGALPTASNMAELVFNGELAKVAQAWCDACVVGHDCYNCRKITSDSSATIGQNGYFLFNFDTVAPDPTAVVDAWFDEINDLTSINTITNFQGEAGHFTQVAWAKTKQVGCGWTVEAPDAGAQWNTHYVFCNYNPAGNFLGQSVYVPGTPASNCGAIVKENEARAYDNLCPAASFQDPCE